MNRKTDARTLMTRARLARDGYLGIAEERAMLSRRLALQPAYSDPEPVETPRAALPEKRVSIEARVRPYALTAALACLFLGALAATLSRQEAPTTVSFGEDAGMLLQRQGGHEFRRIGEVSGSYDLVRVHPDGRREILSLPRQARDPADNPFGVAIVRADSDQTSDPLASRRVRDAMTTRLETIARGFRGADR